MRLPASIRRSLSSLALAMLVGSCLSASALPLKQKKTGKRDLRAEVLVVDEEWRQALSSSDTAMMDKLLADDYLGISGNGAVMTKFQQIDRMRNRTMVVKTLTVDDLKIKVAGQVAIITSSVQLDATVDSRPVHGKYNSMRVYHRVGGQWRITNFEATPMRPYPRGDRED